MATVRDDLIRLVGELIEHHVAFDRGLTQIVSYLHDGLTANATLRIGELHEEVGEVGNGFRRLLDYIELNVPPEMQPLASENCGETTRRPDDVRRSEGEGAGPR